MWMRIATPHRRAFVLENLHVVDISMGTELLELLNPYIDYFSNGAYIQFGQRQVMSRRKTDHSAKARFAFGHQQLVIVCSPVRCIRQQGAEVVLESVCFGVFGISYSAGTLIAGT